MKKSTVLFLIPLFSIMMNVNQVTAQDQLPGDTLLPSTTAELTALANLESGTFKYSVQDYFERPKTSSFKFSPNGKYFSYREKDDNAKRHVYVKNTETDEVTQVISEKEDLVRGYGWANDERLIYVKDKGGDENFQLYAVNIDGTNEKALTPYEDVKVNISESLKDQPDFMIIEMNLDNKQVFEPYKININTGELEKLFENKDPNNPISGYTFDKDGNLRGYAKQINGTDFQMFYQPDMEGDYIEINTLDWKNSFNVIGFDYSSKNPNLAYVSTNLYNDTDEIILYDLKNKAKVKNVFSNDNFDVGGMSRSRKRNYEIDYFYVEGERYEVTAVSETAKAMKAKFDQQFTGQDYYISDQTDEEDKYLLYVTSDRLYGEYWLYDTVKDSFKKIMNLMPQLDDKDMAEMRPIQFKSRDGLNIYGYITIPKEAKDGKKVPLILNPHGGPYGPRDSWGFNPETQLFASRGYATLQINYRGSGGFGKSFYLAGCKQIGRKMLDDLEDGVQYVIDQGWVDESKIAVYGASYGGLATLGSLVKTPDKYVCGVDYVGVSNLFTFYNSFPEYWKPYLEIVYEQWYDPSTDEELMKAASPALNVDKITKPLFIVQGANDPRVNIHESDQVVKSLRDRGFDVPYMVKYNEGHGFGHEDNRIELYQAMMGFFAKHLK